MSARTTTASTVSLRRPRAPVSVVTAAVMVGEKLTTVMVSSSTMASLARPAASGAIGSHGHRSHAASGGADHGDRRIVAVSLRDVRQPSAESIEVQRQPGDERDERRRDS